MRGLTPFHAGSFTVENEAVAICGYSGAGKSTLIAAFETLGHAILSDDLTAIKAFGSERPCCFGGLKRAKLTPASLELLQKETSTCDRYDSSEEKYLLSNYNWAVREHYPLSTIFEMKCSDSIEEDQIDTVRGIEKLQLIERNLFKPSLVDALQKNEQARNNTLKIAASEIKAFRITRSLKKPSPPTCLANRILDLLK